MMVHLVLCAVAYGHEERSSLDFADGMAQLPEFQRVLEIVSRLPADENGDGLLSKQEVLRRYGTEGAERVMPYDTSGDGSVSLAELHEGTTEEVAGLLRLVATFPGDEDGDGALSAAELVAGYGSEAKALVMPLDNNGDGVVSLAELAGGRRSDHELEFDVDGDGSLSKSEVVRQGWSQAAADEIFQALDADADGRLEAHEVVDALRDRERTGAAGKFLKRLGSSEYLTPRADLRRFWAILKDLACDCAGSSLQPCLHDHALRLELDDNQNVASCLFPANSTILTAEEFAKAAEAVFVPIADLQGDLAWDDFAAFFQRRVSSRASAAVSQAVEARGYGMARSLVVQQLALTGLGLDFPRLARDAARAQTAAALASQQPPPPEVLYDSTAQWTAYVTVMICIFTYIYCVANDGPPHSSSRRYTQLARDRAAAASAASERRRALSALAAHQLTRVYFLEAYNHIPDESKSPFLDKLLKHPIPGIDDFDALDVKASGLAIQAAERDAADLVRPDDFHDRPAKSLAHILENLDHNKGQPAPNRLT